MNTTHKKLMLFLPILIIAPLFAYSLDLMQGYKTPERIVYSIEDNDNYIGISDINIVDGYNLNSDIEVCYYRKQDVPTATANNYAFMPVRLNSEVITTVNLKDDYKSCITIQPRLKPKISEVLTIGFSSIDIVLNTTDIGSLYSTAVYDRHANGFNNSVVFGGLGTVYSYNVSGHSLWNYTFSNSAGAFVYDIERFKNNKRENADLTTVQVGIKDIGDNQSLHTLGDDNTLNVSETVGTPAWTIAVNYTNITDANFSELRINTYYDGNAGHTVNVDIWDYNALTWDTLGTIPDGTGFNNYYYDITTPDDYLSGGVVQVRVIHSSAGNINHDIKIDLMQLNFNNSADYFSILNADGVDNGSMTIIDREGIKVCNVADLGTAYSLTTYDVENEGNKNYTAILYETSGAAARVSTIRPNCTINFSNNLDSTDIVAGFEVHVIGDDIDGDGYENDIALTYSGDTPAPPPPQRQLYIINETNKVVCNEQDAFNSRPHTIAVGNYDLDVGKEIFLITSLFGASDITIYNKSCEVKADIVGALNTNNWFSRTIPSIDGDDNNLDDIFLANDTFTAIPTTMNGTFYTIWNGSVKTAESGAVYSGSYGKYKGNDTIDLCVQGITSNTLYCFNQSGYNWGLFNLTGDIGSYVYDDGCTETMNNNSAGYFGDLIIACTIDGFGYILNATRENKEIVDIIPPQIEFYEPNATYFCDTVNLSVAANEPILTWYYQLNNGSNISFNPNTTIEIDFSATHNITVHASDLAGNWNETNETFILNYFPCTEHATLKGEELNIFHILEVLTLLVLVGIILVKFYNVMKLGEWYDIKVSFLLFVGFLLAWIVNYSVMLFNPEELIYLTMFRLANFLVGLHILLFIIEMFFHVNKAAQKPIRAYKSNEMQTTFR